MSARAAGEMEGKVAIVTGAARGMGLSHATLLARRGAAVVLCDVLDREGGEAAAELREQGSSAEFRALDVTDAAGWAALVESVVERHGGLDVLVNNAGIASVASVEEEDLETWRRVLEVNAKGQFLGIRAAAGALRARGGGSVVNIASVFGLRGAPQYAAYCASKGAVIGLTRTAAMALVADGIRVNAVCPGSVATEMTRELPSRVADRTPAGRRAEMNEISEAVAFLASDRSSFVTGAELVVDGGFLVG